VEIFGCDGMVEMKVGVWEDSKVHESIKIVNADLAVSVAWEPSLSFGDAVRDVFMILTRSCLEFQFWCRIHLLLDRGRQTPSYSLELVFAYEITGDFFALTVG